METLSTHARDLRYGRFLRMVLTRTLMVPTAQGQAGGGKPARPHQWTLRPPIVDNWDWTYGRELAMGDLDGDGFDELLVSAEGTDTEYGDIAGEVWVFDGFDQSIIKTLRIQDLPYGETLKFGMGIVAGDLNADGFDEVIVNYFDTSTGAWLRQARVFWGPDQARWVDLWGPGTDRAPCCENALTVKDYDRDGVGDLIGLRRGPYILAYRGPDFALIQEVPLPDPEGVGDSLAVGDFNGDGFLDFALGAPLRSLGKLGGVGAAWVLWGPDHTVTTLLNDPTPAGAGHFGEQLIAGDLDGDEG